MKITEIATLARKKSNSNTSTFTDADMLLYFKAKIPLFQADIEENNEDYMGSIDYRDLVATGTGTHVVDEETVLTREYNLPTDMLNRLQNVYAKLDGTNWIWMKPYREEDLKIPFEEDIILSKFDNTAGVAGYFTFRSSLFLLTGEIEDDVTGGLKLWNYSYDDLPTSMPVAGTADDKDLTYYGITKSLHEMVATALSVEWKSNQSTPIPLTAEEQKYYSLYNNKDRFAQLRVLNRGEDMSFGKPADPYDNGFNL